MTAAEDRGIHALPERGATGARPTAGVAEWLEPFPVAWERQLQRLL
jgi:hypothetical protein